MTKSGYELVKRVGLLAVVVLTLAAPPALAESFGPAEEAAWTEAVAYWGGATPAGCSSLTREMVPPESLGSGVAGRATPPASGESIPCVFRIVTGLRICTLRLVMIHEYGHLLGFGHNEEPESVMNPTYVLSDPYCQAEVRAKVSQEEAAEDRRDFAILRRGCQKTAKPKQRRACWREVRRLRREQQGSPSNSPAPSGG